MARPIPEAAPVICDTSSLQFFDDFRAGVVLDGILTTATLLASRPREVMLSLSYYSSLSKVVSSRSCFLLLREASQDR